VYKGNMIFEFILLLHTDNLDNRCNLSRYRRSREITGYDIGRLSTNCVFSLAKTIEMKSRAYLNRECADYWLDLFISFGPDA